MHTPLANTLVLRDRNATWLVVVGCLVLPAWSQSPKLWQPLLPLLSWEPCFDMGFAIWLCWIRTENSLVFIVRRLIYSKLNVTSYPAQTTTPWSLNRSIDTSRKASKMCVTNATQSVWLSRQSCFFFMHGNLAWYPTPTSLTASLQLAASLPFRSTSPVKNTGSSLLLRAQLSRIPRNYCRHRPIRLPPGCWTPCPQTTLIPSQAHQCTSTWPTHLLHRWCCLR